MLKKIGHEPSGGQIVKSQEISVFIMLSCWISSSNWIHSSGGKLEEAEDLECVFVVYCVLESK